ncbi:MAG: hypothetical protein HC880_07895 [Bacteroidia bacterium]|nr:hypothetical protein [Bacteroidia bacterium]
MCLSAQDFSLGVRGGITLTAGNTDFPSSVTGFPFEIDNESDGWGLEYLGGIYGRISWPVFTFSPS